MNVSPGCRRVAVVTTNGMPSVWEDELCRHLSRWAEVSLVTVAGATEVPPSWRRAVGKVPALAPRRSGAAIRAVDSRPAALAAAAQAGSELVVDCTGALPSPAEGAAFPLGLWSLHQGDGRPVTAPFAFLAEVAGRGPPPSIVLVRDGSQHLATAHPRTNCGNYWAILDRLLRVAALLPAQALGTAPAPRPWQPAPAAAVFPPPLALLARAAWLGMRERWRAKLMAEGWMIGVIDKPIAAIGGADLAHGVQWIGPREARRYWADPFGLPADHGRIFCEELVHTHPTGTLKELTLDGGGKVVAERRLDPGFTCHLSYPFLFAEAGKLYCIPESQAACRAVIHEVTADGGLQPVCVALDGVRAVDPTLFTFEGRYWLAYSDQELGSEDTLCLAWADSLRGPWRPHPGNPVKIDQRSARPAGTPFWRDGGLMRPSQDCSRTYGGAIAINRIQTLTPDAFAEETVEILRPPPGGPIPDGLHTVSAWGERTLIDGKREWMNPWALRHKLWRRLGWAG